MNAPDPARGAPDVGPRRSTVAKGVVERLTHLGIEVSLQADEAKVLDLKDSNRVRIATEPMSEETVAEGCDLVVVLGGDGTILRGAEYAAERGRAAARRQPRPRRLPRRGGARRPRRHGRAHRQPRLRRRGAHDAPRRRRSCDGELIASSWALNEVSVEKASRERMLEVTVEVDGRPLSSWGCDGVIVSTPTGSTAYAFSAGGPVVWPQVEAMFLVPNAAHALFARPLVLGPDTHLAVAIEAAGDRGARHHVVRRTASRRPAARRAHRGAPRDSSACGWRA